MRRLGLALVLALLPLGPASPEEVGVVVRRLAAAEPGQLWGRLGFEEESPEGPSTPLIGVPVTLYPDLPAVQAELEAIRRTARETAVNYETAVRRSLAALAAYRARLEAAGGAGLVRTRETDRAGFFAFEAVPAGEWLVVAAHSTPYRPGQARKPQAARKPQPLRGLGAVQGGAPAPGFLPGGRGEAKEVDLWVYRVRVPAGQGIGVTLTDRNRWLTGPSWEAPREEKAPRGPERP